jgi:hypothetical protein
MTTLIQNLKQWQKWLPLVLGAGLITLIRLLPLAKAPLLTYGYDFGFYAFASRAPFPSLNTLLPSIFGGYHSPIFLLFYWLHLPWPHSLTVSLTILAVVLGIILSYFIRLIERRAFLPILLLFAFSVLQQQAHLMFLYKTIFASCFMLLAFAMITRRQWKWFVGFSIITLLLHRTTGLVLIGTVILFFIFDRWLLVIFSWKRWLAFILGIIIFGAAIIILQPWLLTEVLHASNDQVAQGIFLSFPHPWLLLLPMSVLGIIGLISFRQNKNLTLVHALAVMTGLWLLLSLPFYERIIFYFDFALLVYAALGVVALLKQQLRGLIILILLALAIICSSLWFTFHRDPLITTGEIKEIEQFDRNHPNGFILISSTETAPWFLPSTRSQRLIAPGLFEDDHPYDSWVKFWQGQNVEVFLKPLPRPLFIYKPQAPLLESDQCLRQLSENFYEYRCD